MIYVVLYDIILYCTKNMETSKCAVHRHLTYLCVFGQALGITEKVFSL